MNSRSKDFKTHKNDHFSSLGIAAYCHCSVFGIFHWDNPVTERQPIYNREWPADLSGLPPRPLWPGQSAALLWHLGPCKKKKKIG